MTLTDDLNDTAAALRAGWPITNLNRARRVRAEEQRTMSDLQDRADKVQEELTRLHSLARGWGWPPDGDDLEWLIRDDRRSADEAAQILSSLEESIMVASKLITDLRVEVAGLRARCEVSK